MQRAVARQRESSMAFLLPNTVLSEWSYAAQKVFAHIRVFTVSRNTRTRALQVLTLLVTALLTQVVFAQADTRVNEASEQIDTSRAATLSTALQENTILRLEDTIRGNQEQPQVLTIVPWQLPVHQRINENKEWQLQVSQLPSIERNAFLRNLAVVKEIKAVSDFEQSAGKANPVITAPSSDADNTQKKTQD